MWQRIIDNVINEKVSDMITKIYIFVYAHTSYVILKGIFLLKNFDYIKNCFQKFICSFYQSMLIKCKVQKYYLDKFEFIKLLLVHSYEKVFSIYVNLMYL